MTYSVSHLVPRTPSARTLAVVAAITVSALTASGLTALAERSHARSSVTPAGVAAHTDPSVVDLRAASPTYRNWESFELRDDEQTSLYVPAGCAHGFQALSELADVSYMIDRAHDPAEDVSIAFDDPGLAIPWPLPVTIMSPRDRLAPPLADAAKLLA